MKNEIRNRTRLVTSLKIAGLIFASIAAILFWITFILEMTIFNPFHIPFQFTVGKIVFIIIEIIGLIGLTLTWHKEVIAGVLFLFTSIALGIHICLPYQTSDFLDWIELGLPYLIAGILLFIVYLFSRIANNTISTKLLDD